MTAHREGAVLLGIAGDPIEATIWRDALAQEGIRAWVRNRDPLAPMGVPLRFDRLEVFVPARDERRARWVIGEGIAETTGAPPTE